MNKPNAKGSFKASKGSDSGKAEKTRGVAKSAAASALTQRSPSGSSKRIITDSAESQRAALVRLANR